MLIIICTHVLTHNSSFSNAMKGSVPPPSSELRERPDEAHQVVASPSTPMDTGRVLFGGQQLWTIEEAEGSFRQSSEPEPIWVGQHRSQPSVVVPSVPYVHESRRGESPVVPASRTTEVIASEASQQNIGISPGTPRLRHNPDIKQKPLPSPANESGSACNRYVADMTPSCIFHASVL